MVGFGLVAGYIGSKLSSISSGCPALYFPACFAATAGAIAVGPRDLVRFVI